MSVRLRFWLVYPYNKSFVEFEHLCAIWGLRSEGSNKAKFTTVQVDEQTFQRMFQMRAKKGEIPVPEVFLSFTEALEVV
jgi:hypothetical protein